jgi:hypothetical protein
MTALLEFVVLFDVVVSVTFAVALGGGALIAKAGLRKPIDAVVGVDKQWRIPRMAPNQVHFECHDGFLSRIIVLFFNILNECLIQLVANVRRLLFTVQ